MSGAREASGRLAGSGSVWAVTVRAGAWHFRMGVVLRLGRVTGGARLLYLAGRGRVHVVAVRARLVTLGRRAVLVLVARFTAPRELSAVWRMAAGALGVTTERGVLGLVTRLALGRGVLGVMRQAAVTIDAACVALVV